MNSDELLTSLRSEVALPDDATAQRLYAQATSERRLLRGRFVIVIALVVTAAIAGVLSTALDSQTTHPARGQTTQQVGGHLRLFVPVTDVNITRSGHAVTSISFTVRDANIPDAMLAIQVLKKDDGQIVFEERVPMMNTGSTDPDTPVSVWSGTLSPSDWTGGCQDAEYMINAAVYPAGLAIDDPFKSTMTDRSYNFASFTCNGG